MKFYVTIQYGKVLNSEQELTALLNQGIPQMLYMDNGPIARSLVFQKVMSYLGVEVKTHMAKGSDGRRVTARAKGKVERASFPQRQTDA